jgi:hypothetical protein
MGHPSGLSHGRPGWLEYWQDLPCMEDWGWAEALMWASLGDGSTDLRLYTSTKLKIVNYLLYSPMHKEQKLYWNNIKTLFKKDLFLIIKYWYIEDFSYRAILLSNMPLYCKVLCLFETKTFSVKVVHNFQMYIF